ncbi:trans-sulfuration enzyme family protein [Sinosporangium siamense]|nr:aminotransferase class I/II-fold pyridoxal phosphate-dependent enzyme [Sinosporangium siamense]
MSDLRPETRSVHHPRPVLDQSHPVVTPLYQTASFVFADPDEFAVGMTEPDGAYVYSRLGNPTVRALEDAVARLEGGVAGHATASGMGAVSTVLLGLLGAGDHMIAQSTLYGGTATLLADLTKRFGVSVTYVPENDPDAVRAAVTPATRLLYLETIANPMTQVADLPAMSAAAREHGLLTVVDNTFASPVLCRPLEHGADISLHSTSKYLGGHTDVIGGIAVFADGDVYRRVWAFGQELGATPDPFAAWLVLRGMRTLALRVERSCANAAVLAERLAAHPAVAAVHWPGLPGHPSREIADRVLSGFGGVLGFDLAGGSAAASAFLSKVRLALVAASLGGVETLLSMPTAASHRGMSDEELTRAGIAPGTVRVATGIEHVEDLWADFAQALDALDY